MPRRRIMQGVVNPVTANNDKAALYLPNGWKAGAAPAVIFAHGRGGDATQGLTNPWQHIEALTDAGIAVLGLDLTGQYAYGHPSAVAALREAVTYLTTLGIAGTGKVGLIGWSMGGLSVANFAVRYPALVAAVQLWSPLLDLRWGHGDYVPAYAPTWTLASQIASAAAEIDTAYTNVGANQGAATTTATNAVTVPASGGAGVNITLATMINVGDPASKGSDGRASQIIVNGVTCTYTGVSATQILGVVSTTAGTVAVVNGTVVSTNYTNNSPGYDPMTRRADFTPAVPWTIIHASDDTTVPPAATDYFKAGAGVNVTVRVKPLGGHSGQFQNVPAYETAALFAQAAY